MVLCSRCDVLLVVGALCVACGFIVLLMAWLVVVPVCWFVALLRVGRCVMFVVLCCLFCCDVASDGLLLRCVDVLLLCRVGVVSLGCVSVVVVLCCWFAVLLFCSYWFFVGLLCCCLLVCCGAVCCVVLSFVVWRALLRCVGWLVVLLLC